MRSVREFLMLWILTEYLVFWSFPIHLFQIWMLIHVITRFPEYEWKIKNILIHTHIQMSTLYIRHVKFPLVTLVKEYFLNGIDLPLWETKGHIHQSTCHIITKATETLPINY